VIGPFSGDDKWFDRAAMTDRNDKRASETGAAVKDSRQDRLKQALRENLKRRKSQARGRDGLTASPSEHAGASLDDAGGKKPGE
jgi:hypothetical protein